MAYVYVLKRFTGTRSGKLMMLGVQPVATVDEDYINAWIAADRARAATTDEVNDYEDAHQPPSTGGGASTFADLTGDPTDNAALAALIDAKADQSVVDTLETTVQSKADTSTVNSALAGKASTGSVAAKADQSAVDTLTSALAAKADASSVPSFQDVVWGTTYDTYGGTTFSGVGTSSISKTSNDSTWRTGGIGSVPLTNEGILRHVVGITPSDTAAVGFGFSHSVAFNGSGLFTTDVDYGVILSATPTVYYAGSTVATFSAAKGDILEFRIKKDSQGIRWVTFWQNNTLVWKFAAAPTMNQTPVNVLYSVNKTVSCQYQLTV